MATPPPDRELTRLLRAWRAGDENAADALVSRVYAELRGMASNRLRAERDGHTLQPTALVHEAWLRLNRQHGVEWQNRAQFFAIAARTMRRILVDHARRRLAFKRGDHAAMLDRVLTGIADQAAAGQPGPTIRGFAVGLDAPVGRVEPFGSHFIDHRWEDTLDRAALAGRALGPDDLAELQFTSGTTGEPKGVLYSNRSMLLHTFFLIATRPDLFAHNRKILPVVPLFHANAWSLPYITPLTGCKFILPGAKLDGPTLYDLMESEGADAGWGVPTVWLGLIEEFKKRGRKPANLRQILSGGSAVPQAMIDTLTRDYDIEVTHGWGMTEMSPVGTLTVFRPEEQKLPPMERAKLSAKQGRRMFGVDLKVIDEKGNRAPADGQTSGELFVRGSTIVSGYFNNEEAGRKQIDSEGWFGTGDVAKITPDQWLLIVDRTKDLVKSGGEWISSIDVENAALACKGLANCAVIGVPHPKWDERPLLVAVKAPGAEPTKAEILDVLASKIAKWQMPDDVVFVDALPMTATGKISKKDLRAKFADYKLPA